MRLQFPPPRPVVGLVMVVDVAEQQTGRRLVHDDRDVRIHTHRLEVLVLRFVQLVELQSRCRQIHLEVKGRGLDGFLLLSRETGEAIGEGVGDEEVHSGIFNAF